MRPNIGEENKSLREKSFQAARIRKVKALEFKKIRSMKFYDSLFW